MTRSKEDIFKSDYGSDLVLVNDETSKFMDWPPKNNSGKIINGVIYMDIKHFDVQAYNSYKQNTSPKAS